MHVQAYFEEVKATNHRKRKKTVLSRSMLHYSECAIRRRESRVTSKVALLLIY